MSPRCALDTRRWCLVDNIAHRLDADHGRWEAVEALLVDGIDVITTVDISNLESMGDIVAGIIGSAASETVPDSVVRGADQIELVDMSPEALRRRLAHGHVYPPGRVDAALANLFRPEVLGKLRQLSLLWVADRVEEQIERYIVVRCSRRRTRRSRAGGGGAGGQGGDQLVRRAARIAGRTGAHLTGVHVVTPGKTTGPDLERQRGLLVGLGGVYREIVGDRVAEALAEFARVEQATQLVIGAVPHEPLRGQATGGTAVGRRELIDSDRHGRPAHRRHRRRQPHAPNRSDLSRIRLGTTLLDAICGVGSVLHRPAAADGDPGHGAESRLSGSALMFDLCLVMAVAAFGGLRAWPRRSVAAFGLTNWFLDATAPHGHGRRCAKRGGLDRCSCW